MKKIFLDASQFNSWANRQLGARILALPPEAALVQLPGSFPSLQATILHMLDAETIWWNRLFQPDVFRIPSRDFSGNCEQALELLWLQNGNWEQWVENSAEETWTTHFHYKDRHGNPHTQLVYRVLHHVFNHGTYHRGQIVTQLRQLGCDNIPGTDFIIWAGMQS
jgi:uncharacterized damage-inducible protein DinB